jgi:hypothetical protein
MRNNVKNAGIFVGLLVKNAGIFYKISLALFFKIARIVVDG